MKLIQPVEVYKTFEDDKTLYKWVVRITLLHHDFYIGNEFYATYHRPGVKFIEISYSKAQRNHSAIDFCVGGQR